MRKISFWKKYVNSIPLYRQEKDWEQIGIGLSRATMANWIIRSSEDYLLPVVNHLQKELLKGAYTPDTPAAIVYKATWPDERKYICTVGTLAETAAKNNVTKTALMIIGDAVAHTKYDRSKLYDPTFTTEFREATK